MYDNDDEVLASLPEYARDLFDAAQRLLLKLDSMSAAGFTQVEAAPEREALRKVVEHITGTAGFVPVSRASSKQYASRQGGFCPLCLSRLVFVSSIEPPEHGVAERGARCPSCAAHWTEVYRLEGYRDLEV